ncbi:MAG: hypothetical protein PUC60_03940 [Clostridiales bacterium]|nr:hypothetical protein [Clostridiales bacterium]
MDYLVAGEHMAKDSGYEISPMNPGWIKRRVPDEYADDSLRDLIMFFVINTPCTDLSSSSIDLCDYGWGKDIWKNEKLKKALFQIAGIERGSTFVVAQKTNEMKSVCEKASLKKNFHKSRDIERIAIFKGRYNEFLSICYHIRNAFAHGRLAMYDYENGKDIVFVLEDGVKKNGEFQVRSRMVLKKSTLIKWMLILKSGIYPETEA